MAGNTPGIGPCGVSAGGMAEDKFDGIADADKEDGIADEDNEMDTEDKVDGIDEAVAFELWVAILLDRTLAWELMTEAERLPLLGI